MDSPRPTTLLVRGSFRELVEYVEIALVLHLTNDACLLQQVVRNLSTNRLSMIIEHDLQVFSLTQDES